MGQGFRMEKKKVYENVSKVNGGFYIVKSHENGDENTRQGRKEIGEKSFHDVSLVKKK